MALGAGTGSLFLFAQALLGKLGKIDCAGLTEIDCDVLKDTRLEMVGVEAKFAVVLAGLAIAGVLFFRSLPSHPAPP
jgi:hypothetical protein